MPEEKSNKPKQNQMKIWNPNPKRRRVSNYSSKIYTRKSTEEDHTQRHKIQSNSKGNRKVAKTLLILLKDPKSNTTLNPKVYKLRSKLLERTPVHCKPSLRIQLSRGLRICFQTLKRLPTITWPHIQPLSDEEDEKEE